MIYVDLPLSPRRQLQTEYEKIVPVYEKILEDLVKTLKKSAELNGNNFLVRYRLKDFQSWYSKLMRLSSELRHKPEVPPGLAVTDVLGIRLVCPFLEGVQKASALVHELFNVTEVDVKGADYPYQYFGYESVHLLIDISDSFPEDHYSAAGSKPLVCEIQIRTILQEAWAEVEHELIYKSSFSPLDEPLKRKLAALNANLTLSDIMFQEIRDYQKELNSALKQRRKNFYERINYLDNSKIDEDIIEEKSSRSDVPKSVDSLLLDGLIAHNKGSYSDAVEIYSLILKRDVREDIKAVIYIHRGMAYFSEGDSRAALIDFNKALKLNPEHAKALYYRAVLRRMDGNYDSALADLGKCVLLEPQNMEYLTAAAETWAEAGDLLRAEAECRAVLEIDPSFKPALRLLERIKDQT